ncbi:hypothetical protein EV421DRAFT_1658630, partial [Armillaria borealis]
GDSDGDSYPSSSEEEEEEDSDAGEDITGDPHFIPRASLFDPSQPGNAFASEQDFDFCQLPRVFDDHPSIRNAYIRVFTAAAFDGITHKAAASMLQGYSLILESARHRILRVDDEPEDPFPGLDGFAQTLPTVEKRLGVSTEGFITYLFICNSCWDHHYPSALARLPSPSCTKPDCTGKLYTIKRLFDGTEKRTPLLTVPFVPPSKAIQRMCLQPGKVEQWQHWRGPDDVPQRRPPTAAPPDGYDAFGDLNKPMKDVMDGWAWRTI